jgi:hypothetical protein
MNPCHSQQSKSLLWVNKDADNLKSRDYLRAVTAHVNLNWRYERARKLRATISRSYFPWREQGAVDGHGTKPADERIHGGPPKRPNGLKWQSKSILPSSPLLESEQTSAPIASKDIFKDNQILGPLFQDSCNSTLSKAPLSSILSSSLDPFFPLPKNVSRRERSLLHLCTDRVSLTR